MMEIERCPGLYCGRMFFEENNTWSNCGACPRGYRVNETFACALCNEELSMYNYLYLGFMGALPLVMHWFFIDVAAKERGFSRGQLILHFSAFVEVVTAAVITLLSMEPVWQLKIYSCRVNRLSDWYTLFHNPTPHYGKKLHCTQEAVYPLQTMVLLFYFLCLINMMILRPLLNRKFLKAGKSAVYCALYFLPILTVLHAVAGGLIYYAFPYLSIVISMISNATHFSIKLDQSMKSLMKTSLTEMKNIVIILGHWLLMAYGILSLRQHYAFLAFVPFPAIFYILTVKFTDPTEFRDKDRSERNS
ncbi:JNK1/MAPK8-associated membrane protein-like [Phlebotomus papatasi]|nr:JNK1/MAPK8-associated membrane protein-like [Phlebotomus papatasi]XP_055716299.1 JNK1/MAPK8-associated membrane protein-like [Phlebotomus papatasi]